ncbi:MAG: beta-glucosidase, partial [Chloroflexi bacterium]
MQGDDLREGVGATLKHFLGYGWSEGGLNWAPSHIPARELREVFAKPFAAAIREANAFSVMNAYHEHDGVPCGSSQELLTKLLREELGFNGLVVADYFTVNMFVEYHHIAADKAEAAKLGIEATIDIELPEVDCYGEPLRKALAAGDIDMAFIDAAVLRVLEAKFTLGLFENPYVDSGAVAEVFSAEENRQLSREIARKSLVLLKNEGDLLPLKRDLRKIAVIGPHADSARLLQGDYHYPSHLEGMFLPGVSIEAPMPQQAAMEMDWSDHLPPTVTILQGIRDLVGDSVEVVYAKGCEVKDDDTSGISEAVQAAQGADVAIVVVGEKSGLSPLSTSGESIDRASLGLMGAQQQLVEAIHASGTPTVVVLVNGRPLSLPWIDEHIPAIVEAWLPAEEGGAAVAEVLFGEAAPGGKLPMSIPRDVGQVPVYYNHKPSGGRTNWQGDYIDMSVKPLYPFGHGLSYTTFEYSDLQITPQQCQPVDTITVRCTVRNSGARAGEEVVQLY